MITPTVPDHPAKPATVREFQNAIIDALLLARRGQREGARDILHRLLPRYAGDYRVWWALANVTNRPEEAQMAVYKALRLKPTLGEAYELLERLQSQN